MRAHETQIKEKIELAMSLHIKTILTHKHEFLIY